MPDEKRNAWDQLEDEPSVAYHRFLIYRDLGPARTLAGAFAAFPKTAKKSKKSRETSGQWNSDSTLYHWRERASAWDVAMLVNAVPETATTIFRAIQETARVLLVQIQSGQLKPRSWRQLQDTVSLLAGFISPEVITQTIDHARNPGAQPPGQGDPPSVPGA